MTGCNFDDPCYRYLTKPVSPAELFAMVQALGRPPSSD
jgi:hypothetical protein